MSKQSRRPNRAARHVKKPPPTRRQDRWRPGMRVLWALALAGAVGLVAAVSLVGRGSNANAAGPLKLGAVAPAVTGLDVVSGRQFDSKALAGKNVLYFLNEGVMCQACLVQIQDLEQHAAGLRQRGIALVSVTNDDADTLRQAASDYGITTPLIADSSRAIVKSFGVLGGIPSGVGMHNDTADHTFVLVDKTGHVQFIQDYPGMWIGVAELLKKLPKLS